jgi:hypothetical protein
MIKINVLHSTIIFRMKSWQIERYIVNSHNLIMLNIYDCETPLASCIYFDVPRAM